MLSLLILFVALTLFVGDSSNTRFKAICDPKKHLNVDCHQLASISESTSKPTTQSSLQNAALINPIESTAKAPNPMEEDETAYSVIERVREELHKRHHQQKRHVALNLHLTSPSKPLPSPPQPKRLRFRPKSKIVHPILKKKNISLNEYLNPSPRKYKPIIVPELTTASNVTQTPTCTPPIPYHVDHAFGGPNTPPDSHVPGTLALTQDSPFVHTSCDLRNIVGPSTHFPRIVIQGKQFEVLDSPKDARTITLGDTYCGSNSIETDVERILEGNDIDPKQDWIEIQDCRVEVVNGEDIAWTNCDLSKVREMNATLYNGECIRIDCNQYTLMNGGRIDYKENDLYERKRTCQTAFGHWVGNINRKKDSRGGGGDQEEKELPQHTLTVESANKNDLLQQQKKENKKNLTNDVDDITNHIEEELMKSVEMSLLSMSSSSHVQFTSSPPSLSTIATAPFQGNDQVSKGNIHDAALALHQHYIDSVPSLTVPVYHALSQVRSTTQLLALLESVIAGLSPLGVLQAVISSAYIDEYDKIELDQPLLLGDVAAARISIRGSPWIILKKKKCAENFVQRIKRRENMILLLEGLLLKVNCRELRIRSSLDDSDKDNQFTYKIQLDRKWNWPSSTSENGLPMYRLRLTPLPKVHTVPPPVIPPLPCNSINLKEGDTTMTFDCCKNLVGLNCLDDTMIKVTLPHGMEDDLSLLQYPISEHFGPLVNHCPIKVAERGIAGSSLECSHEKLLDDKRSKINGNHPNEKDTPRNKRDTDFNGNKVPHSLSIQNAKINVKKKYELGDYPGGDPDEDEKQKNNEKLRIKKLLLKKDLKDDGKKLLLKKLNELVNDKKKPTWGPIPAHANGPRGGSNYMVDPNTGKVSNLDHGQAPEDKLRIKNAKTYQDRMNNGWDSDTAANGGYAPGQNPNLAMSPFKGTTPSSCDVPSIMAPPPWTLIPTGPGLLAMPGTALPLTYFDNGKCNLIVHLLTGSGMAGIGMNPMKGLVDWIKTGPGPKMPPWESGAAAKEVQRAGMLAGGGDEPPGSGSPSDSSPNGGRPGGGPPSGKPPAGGPPAGGPPAGGPPAGGPPAGGPPAGGPPAGGPLVGDSHPDSDAPAVAGNFGRGGPPNVGSSGLPVGRPSNNVPKALSTSVAVGAAALGTVGTSVPPVSPASSSRGLGPMKPSIDSYDTKQIECGDCHGTKSIVGKDDKYSYFGPLGPLPLNQRPISLPNSIPQKSNNPLNGDGTDWVGEELKKYSHQPLPDHTNFNAPLKTDNLDYLARAGGFPNKAGPPSGAGGKEAAFPLYNDALTEAATGELPPPPLPGGAPPPGAPPGAGGAGGCMFCPLLDLINNLPFLPIVPLPDIPAPFMKWPYSPPSPPAPPPPPTPKPLVETPADPIQEKQGSPKDKKIDKMKKDANLLASLPPVPEGTLQSKPNDGKAVTPGGSDIGKKCGTCFCEDCKPKGNLLTKTIPALVTMCEDPTNYCSKWVCECVKRTPKLPSKTGMPKPPQIPKPPKIDMMPPPLLSAALMKAMVPTMMGIPPPGMGGGAKAAGGALAAAALTNPLKKDPYSAGKPPSGKGPTAIEKALCKIRQEQECARKKPKAIHFPSKYDAPPEEEKAQEKQTNFIEFMTTLGCSADNDNGSKSDCAPIINTAESEPIDPLKVIEGIMSGQSTDDMEYSDLMIGNKELIDSNKNNKKSNKNNMMSENKCRPYAIVRFQGRSAATAAFNYYKDNINNNKKNKNNKHSKQMAKIVSQLSMLIENDKNGDKINTLKKCKIDSKDLLSNECKHSIEVNIPTKEEIKRALCRDETIEPTGSPILNPCDLITFHVQNNTNMYRVMKVNRLTNELTLDRPYRHDILQNSKIIYDPSIVKYSGQRKNGIPIEVPLSGSSYKIYKHDNIPNYQNDLEQLALKKMKCTTMGCIDSIEIQEKSIAWSVGGKRSLNGLRKGSPAAVSSSENPVGLILPKESTKIECKKVEESVGKGEYQKLTAKEIAAISDAARSPLNGAALKEYEDMPADVGGEGWPGVNAATRKDTMETSQGATLKWRNRI